MFIAIHNPRTTRCPYQTPSWLAPDAGGESRHPFTCKLERETIAFFSPFAGSFFNSKLINVTTTLLYLFTRKFENKYSFGSVKNSGRVNEA